MIGETLCVRTYDSASQIRLLLKIQNAIIEGMQEQRLRWPPAGLSSRETSGEEGSLSGDASQPCGLAGGLRKGGQALCMVPPCTQTWALPTLVLPGEQRLCFQSLLWEGRSWEQGTGRWWWEQAEIKAGRRQRAARARRSVLLWGMGDGQGLGGGGSVLTGHRGC